MEGLHNIPTGDSRGHIPRTHDFHNEHERQHGEEVVVRAEGRQPVHGQVVHPDDQHGHVDRQHPEHEDEDGGGVVVEIIMGAGAGVAREAERAHAGADLHDREDHVRELVRDESRDEEKEDGGRD